MNEVYQTAYDETLRVLAEFGTDITIRRGSYVYDPASGKRTGDETTFIKKGVRITDFSRLISDFRIIGNASTMKIDMGVMFGGDFELKADDTMEVEGTNYSIVQIKHIAPAGVTILQYALGRV